MHVAVQRQHLELLNDLFTRSYYSAAGYVFESQPFVVAEDANLLDLLSSIRREDRRHAQLLAGVIDDLESVPIAGAFPYWYRDLNYLSVPYLAGFVAGAIADDLARYAAALTALPADAVGAKATLTAIRRDKQSQLEQLAPMAAEARVREAAAAKSKIDARKAARAARLAKEKAAKEGAKRAAAKPVAATSAAPSAPAGLDANEPGITPKERARRTMLAKRGGAPGAAPSIGSGPSAPAGLDPNEPGIPPKEKARRAMLLKRGGGTPAAAPSTGSGPSAPAAGADFPDPDEPGIAPKEKARRAMLKKRAASGAPAAPSAGPAAAAAPAPVPAAPADELLDPDEPGISPKEKGRRTMLRKRAQGGGSQPPAAAVAPQPAAPAAAVPEEEDLDPDEPGLSPKEKARRTMLRKRRAK